MIRNDTHEVRVDRARGLVVKRYRSARRSEPAREWTALSLLARFAPGLAPVPVSADLNSEFPVITMSLLPGTEMSATPVTPAQAGALAEALERLWRSVPSVDGKYPAGLVADDFLAIFDLTRAKQTRVREFRRLAALYWLIMLRPGGPSSTRNPPGTLERQAARLLGLLA